MEDELTFGQWLKKRRKALGISQAELAARVPCATDTVHKIETGQRMSSDTMAQRLADCLNVSITPGCNWKEITRGSESKGKQRAWMEAVRPPTNLPAPTTPLFGRQGNLAAIQRLLLQGNTNLLTLVGPPGIGKTRLAIQAARQLRDYFADGAFFVDLTRITDPGTVASLVSQTLGLVEDASLPSITWLLNILSDRQLLLVMDNFEHVIPAATFIAEMIAACPLVKVLVTSREALRIRAEHLYRVPALDLPELHLFDNFEALPGSLEESPALALFVDCAQTVEPEFNLSSANIIPVVTLCYRLDRLPLAIELIASRVNVLQPHEIIQHLSHHLILHSDGLHDLPERQRTLMNAIGWSFSLLNPEEQVVFNYLGLFPGGATLRAIEMMVEQAAIDQDSYFISRTKQEERVLSLQPDQLIVLLHGLINKNLIIKREIGNITRYNMLQTIRDFALENLEESGRLQFAQRQQALCMLKYFRSISTDKIPSLSILDQFDAEQANLRAALQWSIDHYEVAIATNLVCTTGGFWSIRDKYLIEGRSWTEKVVELADNHPLQPPLDAQLLNEAGTLAYLQGDLEAAQTYHRRALAVANQSSDHAGIAYALFGLSNVAMNRREYQRLDSLLEECLPLAIRLDDRWLIAMVNNNWGEAARLQGDLETALSRFRTGLSHLEAIGDQIFSAILLDNIGSILQVIGDYNQALLVHQRCLELSFAAGMSRVSAVALEKLSGVASQLGNHRHAARLLGAAERIRREIASPVEALDLPEFERIVSAARGEFEEEQFIDSWEEGYRLSMEQAVKLARQGEELNNQQMKIEN